MDIAKRWLAVIVLMCVGVGLAGLAFDGFSLATPAYAQLPDDFGPDPFGDEDFGGMNDEEAAAAAAALGGIAAVFAAVGMIGLVIYLGIIVLTLAGLWAAFAKAGKPGWAAIIPIYNIIVLLEISNKELWWIILFFIPCVNVIAAFIVYIEFAKAYGFGAGMGIGIVLVPFICLPIIGFGKCKYVGAAAAA